MNKKGRRCLDPSALREKKDVIYLDPRAMREDDTLGLDALSVILAHRAGTMYTPGTVPAIAPNCMRGSSRVILARRAGIQVKKEVHIIWMTQRD